MDTNELVRRGANAAISLQRFMLLCRCSFARSQRGQFLHAQQYLNRAVDVLLLLIREYDRDDRAPPPSAITPRRRLEKINPELARQLLAITLHVVACPETALMSLCEQRLRPCAPLLPWNEFTLLRQSLLYHVGETPSVSGQTHADLACRLADSSDS